MHDSLFKVPVRNLSDVMGSAFQGILIPEAEIGLKREGVDHIFLENAEDYYAKYQGFAYWSMLIKNAMERMRIDRADVVVEFGSGFGNSTLPLLDLFPAAHILATDISPNLLSILYRLLRERNLESRCTLAAMDAQRDFLKPEVADLVVGSAILHHLANPGIFIERAMEILKPGGCAIFFEPFEAGLSILRLICLEISAEAARRREDSPGLRWLQPIPEQLEPQIFRAQRCTNWLDLNDKWAFPRSVLEGIKDKVRASELIV
jgi:SAM-dependent methyltransferase